MLVVGQTEHQRDLDDVLGDLDAIIDDASASSSPIGIFPSMYRSVTADIRRASRGGFFADGERLEVLAVAFADRYIDAYGSWTSGGTPTRSWDIAFRAATDGQRRMIVQHLLAGMNAHINLDLGIVAADSVDGDPMDLYDDFMRVNDILFTKLDHLQEALNEVAPRFAVVDKLAWRLDEGVMSRLIADARDDAWTLAIEITEDPTGRETHIRRRDEHTADIGSKLLGGTRYHRAMTRLLASSEPKDPCVVIDAFRSTSLDLDRLAEA